jgi:D-alanyl-D-alanine carboxypeptidase (penicillin-binding protein 5/6)
MRRLRNLVPVFAALAALCAVVPAQADIATSAEHAIIMDGDTGQVLWAKDADTSTPPASMSKLMTLDILFQELKDGRIKLTDTLPVSQRAWSTQGSKMFVVLNSQVAVQDLIRGIIITSGNDACVVVAEGLGGTVEGFVDMMNKRAKKIGLTQSHFVNPNGLDEPPGQTMSVHDLAILARHIITTYPQYYHFFSERSFSWEVSPGKFITQQNRDSVLDKFPGTDGLKTGHTSEAGYGIVTSALRNGQRLILVLNGLRYPQLDKMTPAAQDWHGVQMRGDEAARVMGVAFREFKHYPLFKGGETVGTAQVWQGEHDSVPMVTDAPVNVTMQADSHSAMKVVLTYSGPVQAPVMKGQQIGTLDVSAPDFPGMKIPVYAGESVSSAGFVGRMFLGLRALIEGRSAGQ